MRIKVGEPGTEEAKVYMNGCPLDDCVEADDLEGWAIVLGRNGSGLIDLIVDEHGNFAPRYKKVDGAITITGFDDFESCV